MMDQNTDPSSATEADLDETRRSALVSSLLAKRKEAISGRKGSGIEEEWREDEEYYQGIDDANRAYIKRSTDAAKRWAEGYGSESKKAGRSVVFMNITAPYVDAASARVSDMLLPIDDRCWEIKPTPIPELPGELISQLGGAEEANAQLEQWKAQALSSAQDMQDEIDDCLTESNWHGEVRHLIEDSARIGAGVIKGPYPIKRSAMVYRNDGGVQTLMAVESIKPGSRRIDPWDFYPDPACGESIHNGSYTWEREYLSARQLKDMLTMPGYDTGAIFSALREGPRRVAETGTIQEVSRADDQFEMWIFYGDCDAKDLQTIGVEIDQEDETPVASVMAVIVNDRIIKATLNVLDTGAFPYDVLAWQRRPGMPWGTGVARKIRTTQRILNAGVRALMDNSGASSGPQIVIGNGVTPADNSYTIRGSKVWRAEDSVTDVRAAFAAFNIPSVQAQLMAIIQWAMTMAEDTTGMPAMLQGIRGDAPDTLGGMQMQNNNASSVLRRLAKRFDDYMTQPHIRRYYDWMMQHSDKDNIKGDFQIDVRASSALVERDAQQQFLLQMASMSRDPVYGIDPAKIAAELAKGQRLDPKRFQYTAEELAAKNQQPTDPASQAKVALIEAQTKKTNAEAVNKSVEGMFSATQAAQNIASIPSVAPLADKMLGSAGFQDQDAAPIIPEESVPGVPPPASNTDPLTPRNPVSPSAGMDQGIEGGHEA